MTVSPRQANFSSYVRLLDSYDVVPQDDREKLSRTGARDPAKRREEKIRHYRWEKEVREKLEVSQASALEVLTCYRL